MSYILKHPTYKALAVGILLSTGLQAGKLMGLETKDVDIKKGRIWIHQMENTKTYEPENDCKAHSVRYVYLTADAEIILRKALEFRKQDSSLSPFLLPNPNSGDGKVHLRAVNDYLKEFIHYDVLELSSDCKPRSAHDCKRAYASLELILEQY